MPTIHPMALASQKTRQCSKCSSKWLSDLIPLSKESGNIFSLLWGLPEWCYYTLSPESSPQIAIIPCSWLFFFFWLGQACCTRFRSSDQNTCFCHLARLPPLTRCDSKPLLNVKLAKSYMLYCSIKNGFQPHWYWWKFVLHCEYSC